MIADNRSKKPPFVPPFPGRPVRPDAKQFGSVPPQPLVKDALFHCVLDGDKVIFGNNTKVTLLCEGRLHAKLIAQALSDGVCTFTVTHGG